MLSFQSNQENNIPFELSFYNPCIDHSLTQAKKIDLKINNFRFTFGPLLFQIVPYLSQINWDGKDDEKLQQNEEVEIEKKKK